MVEEEWELRQFSPRRRGKVELSVLERKFFNDVLRVELDVPISATLAVQDEPIDMIVVPGISKDGHFEFKFYNAAPYRPQTKNGVITWAGNQIFGVHPALEKAWLRDEVVELILKRSVISLPERLTFDIKAQVFYAGPGHTGRLAIDRNVVVVEDSAFTETHFSIVNFPDFVHGPPRPSPTLLDKVQIVLDGGDGWSVTLTREETETRGSVTHTGVIAFHDGRAYSAASLAEILTGISTFFAFVAGHHCFPTVTIGYDKERRPVWGRVAQFPDAQNRPLNWFVNTYNFPQGAYLQELFPKFWERWHEKGAEISEAMDLYVRSATSRQSGNRLGAISESYAALEILASLVQGKTIVGDGGKQISEVLKDKGVPRRSLKELNLPAFTKISNILQDRPKEGVYLLSQVRNYGHHPLEKGTPPEIKPDIHDVSQNELRLLVYLHDLGQFYFEHLFLAYCGFLDNWASTAFRRFRPLLVELNSV